MFSISNDRKASSLVMERKIRRTNFSSPKLKIDSARVAKYLRSHLPNSAVINQFFAVEKRIFSANSPLERYWNGQKDVSA